MNTPVLSLKKIGEYLFLIGMFAKQFYLFNSGSLQIGEGEFSRFFRSGDYGEIHSTFPSILFYYGIVPFSLFLAWIFLQLRGIHFEIWAIYIAVFLESFTLLNQRQPFFWLLLILASHPALKMLTTTKERL